MEDETYSTIPIDAESLQAMRDRGGSWAAYQNMEPRSAAHGHVIFLRHDGTPPSSAPDGPHGTGWKYLHIGEVDLASGEVRLARPRQAPYPGWRG